MIQVDAEDQRRPFIACSTRAQRSSAGGRFVSLTGSIKIDADDETIHRWSVHHCRQRGCREIIGRTTDTYAGQIQIRLDRRETRRSEPSSFKHVDDILMVDNFLKDTR